MSAGVSVCCVAERVRGGGVLRISDDARPVPGWPREDKRETLKLLRPRAGARKG